MMEMEIRLGLQLQMAQIGLPCQVSHHDPIVFTLAVRLWLNRDDNVLDEDEWQPGLRLDILVR